jgi:hypothetical protein
MARSLEAIQQAIKTNIRTYPSLDGYLFPEEGGSKTSIFNIIIYVVAAAIFTFETILDITKSEVTTLRDQAISGNAKWVQRQILNFQYGDVVTLVDFVPTYVPVDESARIVTQCSVKQLGSGDLAIKVAKGTAPSLAPLSAPELTALQNYWFGTGTTWGVGFAGVRTTFVNLNPDRMRVQATVYFFGQFVEATVKTNVIAAINNFFGTFQSEAFDGTVFMIKLVDVVQAVAGVSRIVLTEIKARDAVTALASATVIDVQGFYTTVAGYLISEDTSGNLLTNTITMSEETL